MTNMFGLRAIHHYIQFIIKNINNMEANFDLVAEAVYCFNQSTPEMYDANCDLAFDHECRLYELFKSFTPKDMETYQRQIGVYEVAVADF